MDIVDVMKPRQHRVHTVCAAISIAPFFAATADAAGTETVYVSTAASGRKVFSSAPLAPDAQPLFTLDTTSARRDSYRISYERGHRAAGGAAASGRGFTPSGTDVRLMQIVREAGRQFGLDPNLIASVIHVESRANPLAVSPKGARGLMQLMPATARRFGVRDLHDPEDNVRGGSAYLSVLLKTFNNRLDLALAAYNAGEGNVIRYGRRIPPFAETQEYVGLVLSEYRRRQGSRP
jgi:soluble lytic murein transglycosylase-like protein